MKKPILSLTFFLFTVISYAQGYKQTLVIGNLHNKNGTLYIAWYTKENNFRKADGIVIQKTAAVGGKESVPIVFENVHAGIYAIAVFLDENANGKMDTNFLGIPKEKYGFSNNVYPMMRVATFKESSFDVTKEAVLTIRLK